MKRRTRPASSFELGSQRWVVSSWFDHHDHAQRVCEVVRSERDEHGRERVRVRFFGQVDLFESTEALLLPDQLVPYKPPLRQQHAKMRQRIKKVNKPRVVAT